MAGPDKFTNTITLISSVIIALSTVFRSVLLIIDRFSSLNVLQKTFSFTPDSLFRNSRDHFLL